MTSVTAAIIIRNEAEFIEDCLRSLAGNVDEIVLVDTGSQDNSIEIARRFPVRLYDFPWVNDFSAARNFALDRAGCEWILYIDADERFEIPDRDLYGQLLADQGKAAWRLRLHPRVGWTAYSELRLFRNDPRIRFEGAIHENLWPGVDAVTRSDGLTVGDCDLRLHHVGYERDQRPKNPRNIPLLRDALARDPDHLYCWWHLGDCLRLAGDEEAAAETWMSGIARFRAVEPEHRSLFHSMLYLSLLRLRYDRGEAVDELVVEAIAFFPSNLALQWFSARLAIDRGDLETARTVLERLATVDGDSFFEPGLSYDKALFGHLSAELMALCHFRSGRFDEAARLYRVAALTSPAPAACEIKARLAQSRASAWTA